MDHTGNDATKQLEEHVDELDARVLQLEGTIQALTPLIIYDVWRTGYHQMTVLDYVGNVTFQDIIEPSVSTGVPVRFANSGGVGSRTNTFASGIIDTSGGSKTIRFEFLLDTIEMVDSGVIALDNLNGSAMWEIDINFQTRAIGAAGQAEVSVFGYFRFTKSNNVPEIFPFNNVNNTTFETISTLSAALIVTTTGSVNSFNVRDLVSSGSLTPHP
jgi:hypothetical protein